MVQYKSLFHITKHAEEKKIEEPEFKGSNLRTRNRNTTVTISLIRPQRTDISLLYRLIKKVGEKVEGHYTSK